MDEGLPSLSERAARCIQAAVRVFGADLGSARPAEDSGQPAAVGYLLFRRIFGDRNRQEELDQHLAALARDPRAHAAQDALEDLISDELEDDPAAAEAVLGTLTAFYRRQAEAGSVQGMVDLGDLLHRDGNLDGAKAAYQQAVDAGRYEVLIDMAHLLCFTDNEAARACLDQAISIGGPDLAAHALFTLSAVLRASDPAGAESALLQAIETGHPDWAPAAMSCLGDLRAEQCDDVGARAAYQQAIDTGHREWADRTRFQLACMMEAQGDLHGVREQYRRLVERGNENWAPLALEHLISQLQHDGDVDGLRALHRIAVETGNWSAPEALVAVGCLLEQRGDADGARLAYQQAIDDGLHRAAYLIEKLNPSPKPTAAELDELPPQFDPRNMVRAGLEVLSHGLPELPDQLSYLMAIPVAYWTAQHSAVVLFLQFERYGGKHDPGVLHATYSRTDTGWTADRYFIGTGYSHDPIANPGSLRELDGSAMVTGGGTDTSRHGRASPAVKHIALIQHGREDVRPLESHFGAWVVCTEQVAPFQIEGRDADGNVLARIHHEPHDWLDEPT
ncbi:MAG TPA: hypothetical protein VKB62_08505 [Streptosporangiaceae bacterium]|nr:hypothetical protein [Streptosporangiaceae bacterium]